MVHVRGGEYASGFGEAISKIDNGRRVSWFPAAMQLVFPLGD
jgi:hypothetical protein